MRAKTQPMRVENTALLSVPAIHFHPEPVGDSFLEPFLHQIRSVTSTAQTWPFPLTERLLYSPSTVAQFFPPGHWALI